jgi:hypothetical protein
MKKKTEKGTKRIKGAGNKRKLVLSSSVLASWVWSYTSKETTSEVRSEILLFDKIILYWSKKTFGKQIRLTNQYPLI